MQSQICNALTSKFKGNNKGIDFTSLRRFYNDMHCLFKAMPSKYECKCYAHPCTKALSSEIEGLFSISVETQNCHSRLVTFMQIQTIQTLVCAAPVHAKVVHAFAVRCMRKYTLFRQNSHKKLL